MSSLRCNHDDHLLFIGDSITDAGRTNHCPPLGEGFVAMLHAELERRYSGYKIQVTNKGICGNTIEGLNLRWDRDVLAEKPNWLFIYVGINDAHVTLNHAGTLTNRIASFEDIYIKVIYETMVALPETKITLITPFLLGAKPETKITQITSDYVKAVSVIAYQTALPIISLQDTFEAVMHDHPPGYWSTDGVHPTPPGHKLIAETIINHLTQLESVSCQNP